MSTKPTIDEYNFAPEVCLDVTEEDLKNPGVAKRLIADNKRLKHDVSDLQESLCIAQEGFEKLRRKYHEVDKGNALLKQKVSLLINFEIIRSLSLIGVGSAFQLMYAKDFQTAAYIGIPALIIFFSTLAIRGNKPKK